MSMPDTWEYPWFAAWDMAFHCVALAHVDPAFAKYQLTLLCREWFQHPNGALPAYEWAFDDVNPPVQAWAALEVFAIDGGRDVAFLGRVFDKLLVNFTWWVNRKDADGSNVFEGGFLGLDNIGPIDRSHLPPGHTLEQSDATGWMALLRADDGGDRVDPEPARPPGDRPHREVPRALRPDLGGDGGARACGTRRTASTTTGCGGPTASIVPVKVRSMVGVLPLMAFAVIDEGVLRRAQTRRASSSHDCSADGSSTSSEPRGAACSRASRATDRCCSAWSTTSTCCGVFSRLFDEEAFLSPYGLRALSRWHREHPYHARDRRA